MKIGVTGTRFGMTPSQMVSFINTVQHIDALKQVIEFHHGDCVGADFQSHELVGLYLKHADIHIHPPVDQKLQAFCAGHYRYKPKTHFARNRDIVDMVDVLITLPYQMEHQNRGGTWYTYDYAVKKNKPTVIIWPDGSAKYDMPNVLRNGKSLPNDKLGPNLVELSEL